ncbi:MAG: CHAT domain-containing protein [Pyrinomonadaceae bacterium]|nr:CHAT domain-containing protein [Pyrinomonadaceae bacterium]
MATRFFSSAIRIAVFALLLLSLAMGIWRIFIYQSEVDKGLRALKAAYRLQRPLEPRISGFEYAPQGQTRGNDSGQIDFTSRDRAERILLDAVHDNPNARTFHALGKLYLSERQFDKAIDQFESALNSAPDDAELHNDLGVALLEGGRIARQSDSPGKSLEEFAKSLEHFNRTLELDKSVLPALFNRALLFQNMSLSSQAVDDWRRYLEKDDKSQWAAEARQNLERLEKNKRSTAQSKETLFQDFVAACNNADEGSAWAVLKQGRARAGNIIVERLVDNYIDRAANGAVDEAASWLKMLLYAGEIEKQRVGDRYTSDLAKFYSTTTPAQRDHAAKARELIRTGIERFNQNELRQAFTLFSKASQMFELSGDNAEAMFASSWMGYCSLRIPDTKQSLSIFESLSPKFKEKEYRSLYAQSLHALSDAQTSISEYSKALDYANQSLILSEQIEDTTNTLRCLQQFVSMYLKFGKYRESLSMSLRALELLHGSSQDPKVIWPFYQDTAFDFYWLGFMPAAIEFQKEALRLATEANWPLIKSRSYVRMGLIYQKLQNYEEAIKYGQLALEEGRNIKDESSRLNITANSTLRLGELYRQAGDIVKALESYDEAIRLYEKLSFYIYLYEAHKGKLLCYLDQGNDAAARQEMETTLSLFEQYRSKIIEESNSNSFFDSGQNIYDIAIDFSYSRMNDAQKAFEYVETSHARSLLNLIQTGARVSENRAAPEIIHTSASVPLQFSEIQARMPAEAQVLQYAVLDNKLLIWVVSKSGALQSRVQVVTADKLTEKVKRYLELIFKERAGGMSNEALDAAKELYDLLIAPVESLLDKEKQVCIVPDKILNYLPFNALLSRSSGKFLLEDFKLMRAPSTNIFLACSEAAQQKKIKAQPERLLSVGNPSFDHARFPSFQDLPSAATEAEKIAAYYLSYKPLTGADAREGRIKEEMKGADVIHLAAHTAINEDSPMLSNLLLAKEPEKAGGRAASDGILEAYEIYQLKLPKARLVVLSACQSGIERSYKGEGAVGIARPFIAARVPLVVASLWPVDSELTTELMVSFHRYRKEENLSTIDALRRAELDLLRSSERRSQSLYAWAAFTLIGGYAGY